MEASVGSLHRIGCLNFRYGFWPMSIEIAPIREDEVWMHVQVTKFSCNEHRSASIDAHVCFP